MTRLSRPRVVVRLTDEQRLELLDAIKDYGNAAIAFGRSEADYTARIDELMARHRAVLALLFRRGRSA